MPVEEHYFAEGIVHHNTGKTVGALNKLHLCMMKYPGSRGLLLRKTRESMTQTTLKSFEGLVVQQGYLDLDDGPRRSHRQSYEYPNGSELVVAGLDKPSKLLSMEVDLALIDEATEIDEVDWETVLSRLRYSKMPFQQAIACCNPDRPSHWLNQRAIKGQMKRLFSRHADNPAVTADYLAMLDRLTGVRRLRLKEGIWSASEGLVYDAFDPAIHVLRGFNVPKSYFKGGFIASVDWGFVHAGTLQVWGIDEDGRMYLVHEVYRTQRTIDWWVEQARKASAAFGVSTFVCDSARPDYIEVFKRKGGLHAVEAFKSIQIGLQQVQERLKVQADGKPRLFLLDDALADGPDPVLVDAKRPTCTEREIDSYVWDDSVVGRRHELPVKENDDGLDALRYAVAHVDRLGFNKVTTARLQ